MKLGQKVLIEATIVRRCDDEGPEEEKGYVVKTSRGTVMVGVDEIWLQSQIRRKVTKGVRVSTKSS